RPASSEPLPPNRRQRDDRTQAGVQRGSASRTMAALLRELEMVRRAFPPQHDSVEPGVILEAVEQRQAAPESSWRMQASAAAAQELRLLTAARHHQAEIIARQ